MSQGSERQRRWPHGVDPATVAAVGKVTEALEKVERARGRLYDWHQLIGSADAQLGEGIDHLRRSGHPELAERIERELLGRNVLPGRWSFQAVEEFDDQYWRLFREFEAWLRGELLDGRRHVYEAWMKAREQSTDGNGDPLAGFESEPPE